MPTYLLRAIDLELWEAVKARADRDGHRIKWIILSLLRHYAAKGLPK